MDDLSNQLRQLGDAVEAATTPTSAAQIVERQKPQTDLGLDLDHATQGNGRATPYRDRKHSRLIALAAAALALAAIGSAIFLGRGDETAATLETATAQTGQATDFAAPDNDNGWQAVRVCESNNNYEIDAGNTFYGAYQFTFEAFRDTAERVGLNEYAGTIPSSAPPAVQDAVANAIYLEQGSDAWPVCGRYFEGPQITPVVPQWLGQLGRGDHRAIIFLEPELTEEQITEVRSDVEQILGAAAGAGSMDYVDQQEAYDEFQSMFDGDPQIARSVRAQDMPASFRVRDRLNPRQLELIRKLDGVFNLVEAEAAIRFDPAPPMKISIPAIHLVAPVYPSASIENLARGAVVLGGNAISPVVAGYGSVDGSVFARLDDLRDGDLIEVSYLLPPDADLDALQVGTQMIRTYRVVGIGRDGPATVAVQEVPAWSQFGRQGLTLVADVDGDASLRLVVNTEASDPETTGYGIDDES